MLPGNYVLVEEVSVRIAYRSFSGMLDCSYDDTNVIWTFNRCKFF